MATKKKVTRSAAKAARPSKTVAPRKAAKAGKAAAAKTVKASQGKPAKAAKTKTASAQNMKTVKKAAAPVKPVKAAPPRKTATATKAPPPVAKPTPPPVKAASLQKKVAAPPATGKVTEPVTAKKNAPVDAAETLKTDAPEAATKTAAAKKTPRTTLDDLALDVDEKDELLEEEKRDLAKALRDDDDELLETAFVPTDTSERFILVVDEEGQRRTETVSIVQQILPNAVIEVADDPEEALEVMEEADFDTYVVNFLMPGFSASPFVKAVANHPDHPLLIGFAADKISDALDQRKGLKIIPLKRLFDLDVPPADAAGKDKAGAEE